MKNKIKINYNSKETLVRIIELHKMRKIFKMEIKIKFLM